MNAFNGIYPALITPVNENRELRQEAFEQLLARVYGEGIHGVYVCGQTGEGFQLSATTREAVASCAVRCSPPQAKVIVHVGAPTTAEAVRLARHASHVGAHCVSSLPPVGNYSFEEVKSYYRAIAEASSVPLLIYYFPSLSEAISTTEQVLELCAIPNVIGLKFTDSDFFRLWVVRKTGAVVFAGSDEMLLAGLIMGANGGIGSTYNLIAGSFVKLYECASRTDWEKARHLQNQINEFIQVALRYPIHTVIKQVLTWTGIECGTCIPPRRSLSPAEQADLHESLLKTELGNDLLTTLINRG